MYQLTGEQEDTPASGAAVLHLETCDMCLKIHNIVSVQNIVIIIEEFPIARGVWFLEVVMDFLFTGKFLSAEITEISTSVMALK